MDRLKIKDGMLYVAADGDGVGRKVGRAVIANDAEQLHKISERIDAAQDYILHWAKQNDGIKISGGGDEFTAAIPKEVVHSIESLRKDIEHAFGYTISVGVGKTLGEAGTALLVAKLRGKNRIVWFTKKIKEDIKKAKRRVREKRATQEEYKLAEAYLKKAEGENMEDKKPAPEAQKTDENDCAYCKETDGVDSTHCKYCHDAEQQEGEGACPFCEENGATDEFGNPDSGDANDCPFCAESTPDADECPYCKDDAASGQKMPEEAAADDHAAQQATRIQSPDSNNSIAPAGSNDEKAQYDQMEMNPPIMGKPELGNNSSPVGEGQANPMDNTAGAPVEPPSAEADEIQANDSIIPDESAHSKDELKAIAAQIENETAGGEPSDREEAKQIDDTDIIGDKVEGNTSRPGGYESNTPGDMGADKENEVKEDSEPNLSAVLQEGLDDQADNSQREMVVQMVSTALQGFKASKQVLEAAKEQAPDFYNASIAMLKAMIEMAKMLGLGQGNKGPDEAAEQQPGQSDWHDPFPAHPDKGGEAKPESQSEANDWHDPFPAHPDKGGKPKPEHAASKGGAASSPQR